MSPSATLTEPVAPTAIAPPRRRAPLELFVLAYLLLWIPYIALNRALTTTGQSLLHHPLGGLDILPVSLVFNGLFTYAFMWLGGWWRSSPVQRFGPIAIPRPTRWTALSGLGAAMMLVSVPLSYTFAGVSIPFVQLLMRGDVLLIAPVIDMLAHRRVRPVSWVALALVAAGLVLTVHQRGGLHLPVLCWITIAIYICGYFLRLGMMTKVAKTADPAQLRRFFVQEQVVATPVAILALALIAVVAHGKAAAGLRFGFHQAWAPALLPWLMAAGALSGVIGVFATLILLDERENTYCVPFERSASILGGLAAAYILAFVYHLPAPTGIELVGAGLLILAVALLALVPRMSRGRGDPISAAAAGGDRP